MTWIVQYISVKSYVTFLVYWHMKLRKFDQRLRVKTYNSPVLEFFKILKLKLNSLLNKPSFSLWQIISLSFNFILIWKKRTKQTSNIPICLFFWNHKIIKKEETRLSYTQQRMAPLNAIYISSTYFYIQRKKKNKQTKIINNISNK
jgi:hypothetical protein